MKILRSLLVLAVLCVIGEIAQAQVPGPGNLRGVTRVIAWKIGANMNTTADQIMPLSAAVKKYRVLEIDVTNCSGSVTTAAGGFYTAASKGGVTLVAAGQVYSSLTTTTVLLQPTLTADVGTTALTGRSLYFSLTSAQGSAMTCDLYVIAQDLT